MINGQHQGSHYGTHARTIPFTTGAYFLVMPSSSANFADVQYEYPAFNGTARVFTTITAALAACVSGRGDHILVAPGTYAENVTVSKDGVTIEGYFGGGYERPDIAPSSGVALTVTGQGVVFKHLRFAAPAADVDLVKHQSNGCKYVDCVFDGDATQGNAKALVRLKGVTNDDSYTASENTFDDCLFRGSGGYGVAFDVGDGASNQVGCTHNNFVRCRFQTNDQIDVVAVDTSAGGTYSATDNRFEGCSFMVRNKATHIDLDTTNGATNTNNLFEGCYFNDNGVDTTAIKVATGAGNGVIGCFSSDGIIDSDTTNIDD